MWSARACVCSGFKDLQGWCARVLWTSPWYEKNPACLCGVYAANRGVAECTREENHPLPLQPSHNDRYFQPAGVLYKFTNLLHLILPAHGTTVCLINISSSHALIKKYIFRNEFILWQNSLPTLIIYYEIDYVITVTKWKTSSLRSTNITFISQ